MLGPRVRKSRQIGLVFCALLVLGRDGLADGARDAIREADPAGEPSKMAQLVEQLGARQYAVREKAQAELRRLGLPAFDYLYEAQQHDDIEIALRARYLVKALQEAWASESDSPDVKRILKDYGDENEAGRKSRLELLFRLENQQGIEPICRLVRYEASQTLSKQAALLIMRLPESPDPANREALARIIATAVGGSKRPASGWLRTYAKTLVDADATLDAWTSLIDEELQVFGEQPEHSGREIARELLRWHAELLQRRGHEAQAALVAQRTFDLHDGTPKQLVDTAGWLMKHRWWPVMDQLAARFSHEFDGRASLLYYLAESQLKRGQPDVAQQTVERALQLDPDQPKIHTQLGYELQERGLLDWAEREYRYSLKLSPLGSDTDIQARVLLSEMLHDSARELDAATVLEVLVEALDRDEQVAKRIAQFRPPSSFRSRYHYFRAMHVVESNPQEHVKQLLLGVKSDKNDADVLIALYRVPRQDTRWQEDIRQKIQSAADAFRDEIEASNEQLEAARQSRAEYIALFERELAAANNQFAWLIANTEGDFDEALRCSHRSLELRPEEPAGYLDTLGRCYFAKGDLENAIKYQSRAAELEPHSGLIQRQLKIFQDAWAARTAAPPKTQPMNDP